MAATPFLLGSDPAACGRFCTTIPVITSVKATPAHTILVARNMTPPLAGSDEGNGGKPGHVFSTVTNFLTLRLQSRRMLSEYGCVSGAPQSSGFIDCARQKQSTLLRRLFLPSRNLT